MYARIQIASLAVAIGTVAMPYLPAQPPRRPTTSVKSIRARVLQYDREVRDLERSRRQDEQDIRKKYDTKIADIRERLVEDIEQALQKETKDGDLDAAIGLRDLADYFRKLQSTDSQQAAPPALGQLLIGTWSGAFSNNFPLQLTIESNSTAILTTEPRHTGSATVQLQLRDGRVVITEDHHHLIQENIELVLAGPDRMVVLGWSVKRGKAQMLGPPTMYGLLTRQLDTPKPDSPAGSIAYDLLVSTDWKHRGRFRYQFSKDGRVFIKELKRSGRYRIDPSNGNVHFQWDSSDPKTADESLIFDITKRTFTHNTGGALQPVEK